MSCPKVQRVYQLAMNVARTDPTILIRGETGTGKEVIAKDIHRHSGRNGPLVVVDCGAIPDQLLESELFGYEKGAFTGASSDGYKGKFQAANGGTQFLDEIGEMPLASQVALLRVLEEKRVTPVGSNHSIPIDVRIIAATNRDLLREIEAKRFRADLYYRLCELEIVLPPLRERTDLLELAHEFIRHVESELSIMPEQTTDRQLSLAR
ncbi:transcriptional regulator with PAS, ATPase and Fis domain [Caldalkalibacillus uzonensis]|uniref:Transcriptional regulator with PAS, ATPase and Fis domain n=1 Tax=Caldalkalibacillus uzonensis TaxID=353224 RepID=A0ABU0CXI7_9BACI|nr:sigma-54 factor interaction domain-containing protein [Caldalkalibacillus uzonensis]MDQ0340112.1 transcriptional regulator with PAS, ATPase and Fis domain [Caldalkalibacillus uzonensis]